jgi:hypothetical protein
MEIRIVILVVMLGLATWGVFRLAAALKEHS